MTTVDTLNEEYDRFWAESLENHSEQYIPEKYQLGIVAEYLRAEGLCYTTEAQVFHYPIDILAVDGDQTVAIELKSRNISRGIEQALRDADVVDRSYLSVWEEQVTKKLINIVDQHPIGLMGIDSEVTIYSQPEPTTKQLCSKNYIIEMVTSNVRDDGMV